MTRLTITGASPLDISYNFPAGANNGKISSQKDNLSVETVTYQYDSLNRLISASSSQSWSETYGFDAFGNLLSKTPAGGAPTLSQSVNPATNQIVGQTYDSNGNQTTGPLGTVYYDAENRIAGVSSAGIQYASDSRNKRIWRGTLSSGNLAQQVYFYGVDGQKLGTYTFSLGQYGEGNTPEMTDSTVLLATFFGRKRIGTLDRLGSAKYNTNGQVQSFYPYGEDRGTVEPNDSLKFATYTRDAATGLDYADQRYYANNFGRFMSPDPYRRRHKRRSVNRRNPTSWNRYTYVLGDPINYNDRRGRDHEKVDDGDDGDDSGDDGGGGGGGGGGDDGGGDGGGGDDGLSTMTASDGYSNSMEDVPDSVVNAVWDLTNQELLDAQESIVSDMNLEMMSALPDCMADLNALGALPGGQNITLQNINTAAANLTFIDGSTSMNLIPVNPGNNDVTAPASWYFGNHGSTYAATPISSNVQYWAWNATLGMTSTQIEGGILHELLHNLGLGDTAIQDALNLATNTGTDNITTKLATDCFPVSFSN